MTNTQIRNITRKSIVLGATKEGNIVFADLTKREMTDNTVHFSASFDEVQPTVLTDELVEEAVKSRIDNMDSEYLLLTLQNLDCRPSEVVKAMIEDAYSPIEEFFDNSLYSEILNIDGKEIFFESVGCGQHDTRGTMKDIFIPEQVYSSIYKLWDNCHLSELDSAEVELLDEILNFAGLFNSDEAVEDWVTDLVEKNEL